MGEQVKAVVQPAPGVSRGPDLAAELLAFVRGRIAHYKSPRSVDFVDELPRTPTGKLQKGKLRAQYAGTDSFPATPPSLQAERPVRPLAARSGPTSLGGSS